MNFLGLRSIIAQLREELHGCCERGLYVLRPDGLIGMMAEAAGTAEEEHGGGDRGSENHRVVAGSADHAAGWKACLGHGFTEQGGQVWVKWNRGLLKLPGGGNVHAASGCGCLGVSQDRENGSLANSVVGVTHIE
jgi:hypothetical protein